MGSRVRALPWSWTRRGWFGYKKFIGSLRLPLMLKFLRQFFLWHTKTPHGTRNTTENFFPYSLLALECYGKNHKLTLIISILLNYPVHKAPVKGRKPLLVSSCYSLIYYSHLLLLAQLLLCLELPRDGLAAVISCQAHLAASSNHWRSVCTELKAKDQ